MPKQKRKNLSRSASQPTRAKSQPSDDNLKLPMGGPLEKKSKAPTKAIKNPIKDVNKIEDTNNNKEAPDSIIASVKRSSPSQNTKTSSTGWISFSVKGIDYAFCRACKTDLKKSGLYGPKGHLNSPNHKINIEKIQSPMIKDDTIISDKNSKPTDNYDKTLAVK